MAETTSVATQQRFGEPSERSADEIRRDIAAERDNISETVDKLGDRLQQTVDWRAYVGRYPAVALGLAAGSGLLLSAVFAPRPTPQERIMDAVADLTEDLTDRVNSAAGAMITRKFVNGRTVSAAVTTMALKAAIGFAVRKFGETNSGRSVSRPSDVPTREQEALMKL